MPNCTQCKNDIGASSRFCKYCGTSILSPNSNLNNNTQTNSSNTINFEKKKNNLESEREKNERIEKTFTSKKEESELSGVNDPLFTQIKLKTKTNSPFESNSNSANTRNIGSGFSRSASFKFASNTSSSPRSSSPNSKHSERKFTSPASATFSSSLTRNSKIENERLEADKVEKAMKEQRSNQFPSTGTFHVPPLKKIQENAQPNITSYPKNTLSSSPPKRLPTSNLSTSISAPPRPNLLSNTTSPSSQISQPSTTFQASFLRHQVPNSKIMSSLESQTSSNSQPSSSSKNISSVSQSSTTFQASFLRHQVPNSKIMFSLESQTSSNSQPSSSSKNISSESQTPSSPSSSLNSSSSNTQTTHSLSKSISLSNSPTPSSKLLFPSNSQNSSSSNTQTPHSLSKSRPLSASFNSLPLSSSSSNSQSSSSNLSTSSSHSQNSFSDEFLQITPHPSSTFQPPPPSSPCPPPPPPPSSEESLSTSSSSSPSSNSPISSPPSSPYSSFNQPPPPTSSRPTHILPILPLSGGSFLNSEVEKQEKPPPVHNPDRIPVTRKASSFLKKFTSKPEDKKKNKKGEFEITRDDEESVENNKVEVFKESDISHRTNVAHELVLSEKVYVENLRLCIQKFLEPLRLLVGTPQEIIKQDSIQQLFSNLEDLYHTNIKLLSSLESRIANWNDQNTQIGDLLILKKEDVEIYKTYLKNAEQGIELLKKLEKKSNWNSFIQSIKDSGETGKQDISSLLIQPVQRIPRYELLLTDLIKSTKPTHIDYENLKKALQTMSEIAAGVNEQLNREATYKLLLKIEKSITGLGREIASYDRKLLKEGVLTKICRKKDEKRQFWLFNDMLINATPSSILVNQTQYKLNRLILLENMKVKNVNDRDDIKNGFSIITSEKSFIVYSDTPEEKEDWLTHFKNLNKLEQFDERIIHIETNSIDTKSAPIWVQDKDINMCSLCGIHFNILMRRHHCRNCGKILCSECSGYRIELSHQEVGIKHRVCTICYHWLTMQDGGDLMENWNQYKTEEGEEYWYNSVTHETSWEAPKPKREEAFKMKNRIKENLFKKKLEKAKSKKDAKGSYWEKHMTKEGEEFWLNPETNETSWFNPLKLEEVPYPWGVYFTPKNELYFYNHETGQSSWSLPKS